jgi:hypothetical protein
MHAQFLILQQVPDEDFKLETTFATQLFLLDLASHLFFGSFIFQHLRTPSRSPHLIISKMYTRFAFIVFSFAISIFATPIPNAEVSKPITIKLVSILMFETDWLVLLCSSSTA